jgi:GntR family transcriptional regulator / MocR family aminotransferase
MPIILDPGATGPVYRQIVTRLRAAMLSGMLPAGARLPSSRSLASQLGVARGTVEAAYAVLAGEGVLLSRGPAGTVVSPHMTARPISRTHGAAPVAPEVDHDTPRHVLPFRMGLPALDAFPRKLWTTLAAREVRRIAGDDLAYPDPAGHRPLREMIASYLGLSRGITISPDQVWVTGGFQGALSLIISAVLRPGDAVWVEDPGYPPARDALLAARARLVPVPVDGDGIRVDAAIEQAPKAHLALVTPTHQSPLGVTLSLERRLSLLTWAAQSGAWILEDDYDSEFRYTGHPLPALKSLDHADRVLFAGSFSKVLFPGLRLGYLVVPDPLTKEIARASRLLQVGQSILEQRMVASFMAEGHFARHLRRMRSLYAARRNALAEALDAVFGDRINLQLQAGGMHLIARFTDSPDDAELSRRAVSQGLAPVALSSLTVQHPYGTGLLLGFTNIPATEALAAAERLAKAIRVFSYSPASCGRG